MVCARDANQADDLLDALVAILTDDVNDKARGLATIAEMSGKQIIEGVLQYSNSCYKSVEAAIKK